MTGKLWTGKFLLTGILPSLLLPLAMPVQCAINFPRLTEEEMGELDYEVMSRAFTIHQVLGKLCDECVYQSHLAHLLASSGFQVEKEVPVTLNFQGFVKPLYLDLVVNGRAIYELKATAALTSAHSTQLLNYLFLTNCERGKLVNFRRSSVESKFVNSSLDDTARRKFAVSAYDWHEKTGFQEMIVELARDWGTGLDQSLYTQAIVHCLGGDESVTQQVPMIFNGVEVGNQRFHLASPDAAFRITTFQDKLGTHHLRQLKKLVAPSPLCAMHWINIARHEIHFQTISLK